MTEIIDAGLPVSEDSLKLLESFIDVRLPKSYFKFLCENGGGYPEPDSFLFFGEEYGSSIQRFYGINRNDSYDLVRHLKLYKKRIHSDFIPIACDSGGNQICLGIKGKNRDKVYFWDHEFEKDDGEQPDLSNMTFIANNFDDFINGLYEMEL